LEEGKHEEEQHLDDEAGDPQRGVVDPVGAVQKIDGRGDEEGSNGHVLRNAEAADGGEDKQNADIVNGEIEDTEDQGMFTPAQVHALEKLEIGGDPENEGQRAEQDEGEERAGRRGAGGGRIEADQLGNDEDVGEEGSGKKDGSRPKSFEQKGLVMSGEERTARAVAVVKKRQAEQAEEDEVHGKEERLRVEDGGPASEETNEQKIQGESEEDGLCGGIDLVALRIALDVANNGKEKPEGTEEVDEDENREMVKAKAEEMVKERNVSVVGPPGLRSREGAGGEGTKGADGENVATRVGGIDTEEQETDEDAGDLRAFNDEDRE